jgi:hypothetical protein
MLLCAVMGCVLAIVAGAFVASCGSPRTNDWTLGVEPLPSPARGNSSEPQLSTSARGIMASWIEREGPVTVLKYAERTRSGWTEPVVVVSGSDWFLSYADVPSVTRKADGTLVAQWLRTTDPRTEGYDLLLSYSTDDGKPGAPRSVLITTARNSSTGSRPSSTSRATVSAWCGWTAGTASFSKTIPPAEP